MIAQTIIVASCLAATATAFGPAFPAVALTLGTNPGTALILSSAQVTLAAAAIAGLAIAKEALTLAAVADSKRGGGRSASRHHHHKREVTPLDFSQMFEGVDAQDSADCGKLLVCHSVAKPEAVRSHEEQAIADLLRRWSRFRLTLTANTSGPPMLEPSRTPRSVLRDTALALLTLSPFLELSVL